MLACIAYLPAFDGDFIFDDHILIERNPSIQNLKNIPLFFTSKNARIPKDFTGSLQDDIYRPLQCVSYAVSYALWGVNADMFRAENIILHISNGLLVYFMLLLVFRRKLISFFAALLFLVHPIQVEAVTYLAGRADVLSFFFYLLSFVLCLKNLDPASRHKSLLKAISLVSFAISLLAKEMAATLPLIITLYLFLSDSRSRKPSWKALIRIPGPYFLVLAAFMLLRTLSLGRIAQTSSLAPYAVFQIMTKVFAKYIQLIFFPVNLSYFHKVVVSDATGIWGGIFSYLTIAIFIAICVWALKKNRLIAFFILAYVVALLPVSNIIPLKSFIQERFLYFPSVFIFAFSSSALIALYDKFIMLDKPFYGKSIVGLFILTVFLFSGASFRRNLDWKNEETLVQREILLNPGNGALYFDMGYICKEEKRFEESWKYLMKALENDMSPIHRTMTYSTLGHICMARKDLNAAKEFYLLSLETTPDYVNALNALGDIAFKENDYRTALYYFKKAVDLHPGSALYNSNLGSTFATLGDMRNALKHWKMSLEINPDQPAVLSYVAMNEIEK